MHQLAKFYVDCLKCCGDMAVFRLFTCIWTTREEYLLVFVTVQNLVGIGAVVSIICQL